jgi:hypothetical protein
LVDTEVEIVKAVNDTFVNDNVIVEFGLEKVQGMDKPEVTIGGDFVDGIDALYGSNDGVIKATVVEFLNGGVGFETGEGAIEVQPAETMEPF